MKEVRQSVCLLLSTLIFFTSCSGQGLSKVPNDSSQVKDNSYTDKSAKLIKSPGATEYHNIHCLLQDKDGNLWFGTTGRGVYKYDGKQFTRYTEKDGLSNNSVWSILEDKSGNIWFGTDDGLSKYDGKSILKVPFTLNPLPGMGISVGKFAKNAVWSMMQDKRGTIWVGTTDDLYCFDGKYFSRFLDNGNIVNNEHLQLKWVQCMVEEDNGIIWMGSGSGAMEGVIRFDGKSLTSFKPNGDGWIRCIVKDNKHKKIWFGGRARGNFYYEEDTFINYTQKSGIGNPVLADRYGNIWFTGEEKTATTESKDGIWVYDGRTFRNYGVGSGLGKYHVWSIFEDKNGAVWVGTRNCELYRFNGHAFESFSE